MKMLSPILVPFCNLPYSDLVPGKTYAQVYLILIAHFLNFQLSQAFDRNIGISFTSVPESRVAPPGDRVFFNCKTNVGKGQQIRWLHNGVILDSSQRSDIKITNGQLSIKVRTSKRNRERQTGRYQCVAGIDNMFLMSIPAELNIAQLGKFPEPDTPSTIEANVGNNVIIPCQPPESDPPAIIQWFKDGTLLNMTNSFSLVNLKHLMIVNVDQGHNGIFNCQASNHLTRDTLLSDHVVNLTIRSESELHKPRLLFEPETEYHPVLGEDLTIPCAASGSPKPTIIWEHEAFNTQPMLIDQDGPRELLKLTDVNNNSSGEYTCKIWNYRGRKILRKTLVYVSEKPTVEISSFSKDPHKEGDPLELYCAAEGFPLPDVYWVINGKRRYRGKRHGESDPMLNDAGKLLIKRLSLEDAGIYQCFAENRAGTTYDAIVVRVVPTMRKEDNTERTRAKSRRNKGRQELIPPSPPNVTQLSEDSVVVTWTMPNTSQEVQFFKVQYKDLGKKTDDHKSDWYTLDGEISPSIRSYEIPGLLENHRYRFRIGAVIDNDNVLSKVSKRFHIEANTQKAPTVIPQIKYILPLSPTSLSVQWILAENATVNNDIEGYFINFRESSSAGKYNHLTIFGAETHNHILDNLKPGEPYDIKVRAFNLNGAGPFSKVRYGRTISKKKKEKKKKSNLKLEEDKSVESNEKKVEDEEAKLYLIIGVSLGGVCITLITICSIITYIQRQKSKKKFSSSNAAIHNKYQDTSLQITGLQYDLGNRNQDSLELTTSGGRTDNNTSTESGVHETSFSASATDHSLDDLSQGSTALAQDSSRNLNFTSITPDGESLAEEYTDEPSRMSWKRRRKSEEIL